MKKLKINYECPQLKIIRIEVEGVMALSGGYLDYQTTPSMPYGDDGEQWF